MTTYNVHIYREMRLVFGGIEADTHEAAAAIARDKPTAAADAIDDCEGENLAALVDLVGDEEYEQSRIIDFELERQRRAAFKLLAALQELMANIRDLAGEFSICDEIASSSYGKAADAAIAQAEAAGILPEPASLRLLAALKSVLPYAENERGSLHECWRRDDDPKAKEELDRCDRALGQAYAIIKA